MQVPLLGIGTVIAIEAPDDFGERSCC